MRTRVMTSIGAIAILTISGTLAGCGASGGGSSASKETTVTWWEPNWDTPIAKELVADFQKKNPSIKVKMVETTSATLANKVNVTLSSGTTPDVITELASRTQLYIAKDQLTDLNALFDSTMPKDDFLPGTLADVSKGDTTYAVPFRWDNVALIYNKDLFTAAGIATPPTTVDEFKADAMKLTKGAVSGTGWTLGNIDNTVLRFFSLAASTSNNPATNVKGVALLTESSTAEALDVIAGSIKDGWATKSSLEVDTTGLRQLFINKQVAMYIGGVYDLIELKNKGMNVGTAVWPGFGKPVNSAANGWVYLVPKASKNPDAAKKFVQYLTEPDVMARLTLTFPARASAAKADKFHTELVTPFYNQLTKYSVPAPYDPSFNKLMPTLFAQIQAVALRQATSAEAAKVIQTASVAAQNG